uniref:Nucleolar protein 12 n=1 Tax=Anopheles aquasalis TaxID=42839 RepID=T1DNZ9_ANOAQ
MKRKSEGGNKKPFQRPKLELVFDPEKRAEFLGGFHKRKLHRRKIAQGVLQRRMKEEKKRIRAEAKENMRKLYQSQKPIPELADLVKDADEDEPQEEEYDTENVTVKVVELSTSALAKENNWIGENRGAALAQDETDKESGQSSEDDDEDDHKRIGVVPGMELEGEKKIKHKFTPFVETEDADEGGKEKKPATKEEKPKQKKGPVLNLEGIRSKKELNH